MGSSSTTQKAKNTARDDPATPNDHQGARGHQRDSDGALSILRGAHASSKRVLSELWRQKAVRILSLIAILDLTFDDGLRHVGIISVASMPLSAVSAQSEYTLSPLTVSAWNVDRHDHRIL